MSDPRTRLINAAGRLFYEHGFSAVGVDRVVEEASVAKMSLYRIFGSKDRLLLAWLEQQHHTTISWLHSILDEIKDPTERILALIDAYGSLSGPDWRGCAFINAAIETRSLEVSEILDRHKAAIHVTVSEACHELGCMNADHISRQIVLVGDALLTRMATTRARDPHLADARNTVMAILSATRLGPETGSPLDPAR